MPASKLSDDIKEVILYIHKNLIQEYPCDKLTSQYFIISMLEVGKSNAKAMLKMFLEDKDIDVIKEKCYEYIATHVKKLSDNKFEKKLLYNNEYIKSAQRKFSKKNVLDTQMLLISLMETDNFTRNLFKPYDLSSTVILSMLDDDNDDSLKTNKSLDNENSNKSEKVLQLSQRGKQQSNTTHVKTELNRYLKNLNNTPHENKIHVSFNFQNIYDDIFRTWLKKHNNNVIIVGEPGVGRTSLAQSIAKLLSENQVPKLLENHYLMEIDISMLVASSMFHNPARERMKFIIECIKKENQYILFLDDLDILLEGNKYSNGESDLEAMLKIILNEDKIKFIAIMSPTGYQKAVSNLPNLFSKFNKIELKEPNDEQTIEMLKHIKVKYENFHNVCYSDEALEKAVYLSKRYLPEYCLPYSAIDILDETAANENLNEEKDEAIETLEKQLIDIIKQKSECSKNGRKNYDEIDELTKKEIQVKSLLALAEKNAEMEKEPKIIDGHSVAKIISRRTGIPLGDLKKDDKSKLRGLNEVLKSQVIGQDTAIDEICKIVKRQRVGLSNNKKPSVLLFTGSTGTGKTYLAKKLAENVFGDEKYLVRLDMSEYSDKMAASKLIGSSAGYIGYDNGGLLTEAIKKNKYCVLLLDECEKADDSVFNMLLQVFDEGRLTDNKGVTVDFRDVIIIMTSNIGAQEASERHGGIGFASTSNSSNDFDKDIYLKSIKHRFKPEFINRIDKIIYFNKLTNENLEQIVRLEIAKIDEKLKKLTYSLDESVYTDIVNQVITNISKQSEYGARPIIRELQSLIEDKITDIIINEDIEDGHIFTSNEICSFDEKDE